MSRGPTFYYSEVKVEQGQRRGSEWRSFTWLLVDWGRIPYRRTANSPPVTTVNRQTSIPFAGGKISIKRGKIMYNLDDDKKSCSVESFGAMRPIMVSTDLWRTFFISGIKQRSIKQGIFENTTNPTNKKCFYRYRPQRSWAKVMFTRVCYSVHRGVVSQHALQVSRPTPRGKLRGLAGGFSRPTQGVSWGVWPGGGLQTHTCGGGLQLKLV